MAGNPLAVVTGASSGIGYELAKICAQRGFDLAIAADEPAIHTVADELRKLGGKAVDAVETDLATMEGVDEFHRAIQAMQQPVAALLANAGHGLGHAFLDQDFTRAKHIVDTNITGTIYLIHLIGKEMRRNKDGRILITGSIAGYIPGSYQAVYNGTKAFIDNFSFALREELKDSRVTVTCLMPGATDTNFFRRAEMLDTEIGRGEKDSAAEVAEAGFEAMMKGEGDIVTGWKNKLQTTLANVTPAELLAMQHRKQAAPPEAKH
ncbi:SDR family NAD(P)-dependent oxidoreductase [Dongia soli]|uniref:SDR family NAD(P)-dependent oxidoreductase n=1 Tax=Dongia soli TaxID=600628 RepID=A0ABU5EH92_9PROT|nr:SDR family NAD(P)-dependent oxidoreductase [Dongia soli]MDY0885657.1 SDR family NAD(P)-dependent oxidoreductase [Dongia soli]